MSESIQNLKIGILGGGQLGRMLIQEAINWNLDIHILDPSENASCKDLVANFNIGDFNDYDTVYNFGKNLDLITIEIENVNVEALKKLENEGVKVFPQPNVIELIKDKGIQKEFYKKHHIPTSSFYLIDKKSEISTPFPFVQKLRTGGYDGKGVQVINSKDAFSKLFEAPSVIEELVDIDKELSVIVARNKSGMIQCFPVVEQEFNPEANLVEFLFSPSKIDKKTEEKLIDISTQIITKLDMVGLLAVEFFLAKNGEIYVNEMAPRPHNSGHHTIEGCYTSQFGQMLRAILDLPLGNTNLRCPAVMINLLGEKGFEGDAFYEGFEDVLATENTFIHLYGKKVTKPYRKMGHITVLDDNLDTVIEKAKNIKHKLKIISK